MPTQSRWFSAALCRRRRWWSICRFSFARVTQSTHL